MWAIPSPHSYQPDPSGVVTQGQLSKQLQKVTTLTPV